MNIFRPVKVSEQYRDRYDEYCARHNLAMFLPMTLGVLLVMVFILVFQLVRLGDRLFEFLYFELYITAIVVSFVLAVVFLLYKRNIFKKHRKVVDTIFILSYLGLALMTTAAESLAAMALSQNIVLTAMMLVISSIIYVSYKTTIAVLLIGNISAVSLVAYMHNSNPSQITSDHVAHAVLNLLFMFVATLFVCVPCYNSRTNMFLQELTLEQVNKSLQGTNKKLELLNKQLEKTSMTDALTGVLNRYAFGKMLELSWDEVKKNGQDIAVLMIDIDFFKQYNDNFGHVAGDACLKSVAQTLVNSVRNGSENVFRYGGEEFVVLMPGTDINGAVLTARRIQKDMQKMAIEHVTNEKVVTLSIGVYSAVPSDEFDVYTLINRADIALYKAKNSGRNQYVIYDSSLDAQTQKHK